MRSLLLAALFVNTAFSMEDLSQKAEVKVTLTMDGQESVFYKNYGDTIQINGKEHMISVENGHVTSPLHSSKKWTLTFEPIKEKGVYYDAYAIDALDWHYVPMPNGSKVYVPVKPCTGSPYEQGYEEEMARLRAKHKKSSSIYRKFAS